MTLTVVLSQVFGIYLVIVGAAILLRRQYFLPVFGAFIEERLTRAVLSLIELLAGMFLVVTHNQWSSLPAGIISAFGWMAVVEGTAYLLLPDDLIEKVFRAFNTPLWYIFGGLLSIAIGIYLAGYGFGVF